MPGTPECLRYAVPADLDRLLPLVAAFHASEKIDTSDTDRRNALAPLLAEPALGCIFLISDTDAPAGYLAVTFGWSIEMGGRDAFIDELFLKPLHRNRGLGTRALKELPARLAPRGVRAIHLEVSFKNARARKLYNTAGFRSRDAYHLMSFQIA